MRIVLLGGPGSGKGTQGRLLSEEHGVPAISTGDILRAEIAAGAPLGMRAREYMSGGSLVPDDVVLGVMEKRLAQPDMGRGFILDGFPRSIPQAEGLDRILKKMGLALDAVVKLHLEKKTLIERLTSRWTCPACATVYNRISSPPRVAGICDRCGASLVQRDDDQPDTVRRRLNVYEMMTAPLIDFYDASGLLVIVDGDGTVAEVAERIARSLEERRRRN